MKRKYLKKVVSAALIGTLVLSAVSGCGNSEKESTDSKKTEIFIKSLHFRESYVILSKLFKMEFVNCIRIILNYIER